MSVEPPADRPNPEQQLESGADAARTLLRNSTYFLASDSIIKLLSFIFTVYVVRQLGDERFGLYSTALAYAGIFSIIGDLGMTQLAVREIARGRRKPDELFWNLVLIRLLLSTVATVVITSSAWYVAGYSAEMVLGIFLVCFSFFLHAFLGPVNIILQGKERLDQTAILSAVIQVFFVTAGTLVLLNGFSFYGLIIASYVGVPVAAVLGARYIRRLKLANLHFNIDFSLWLPLLRKSLPFAIITFTLVAATDLDTVLLSLWRSPEEVGWYKAAYNLIFRLMFIKTALLSTLGPQLSRYYGVSIERVASSFHSGFKLLWSFSFPIAVGGTLLAQPIITLLYTDAYANSVPVFAILIWALPLLYLSSLFGQLTTATDRETKAVRVYMTSAILNLVSNIIAIPIWGYVGAAASTILTEVVSLALFYWVVHDEFPLTDLKNTLFKPLVAGLVMGGVILLISDWPLLPVVAVGAGVYGGVLLLLRPFNASETALLQGGWMSLRRKLGWSSSQ
ncbi:MAG: flippase [Chloroflexi bacterium]|nr:MAG: flippase [Chloroflexota bacterium]